MRLAIRNPPHDVRVSLLGEQRPRCRRFDRGNVHASVRIHHGSEGGRCDIQVAGVTASERDHEPGSGGRSQLVHQEVSRPQPAGSEVQPPEPIGRERVNPGLERRGQGDSRLVKGRLQQTPVACGWVAVRWG